MILNDQLYIPVSNISAVSEPCIGKSALRLEIAVIAGNISVTFRIIVADVVMLTASGIDLISEWRAAAPDSRSSFFVILL